MQIFMPILGIPKNSMFLFHSIVQMIGQQLSMSPIVSIVLHYLHNCDSYILSHNFLLCAVNERLLVISASL